MKTKESLSNGNEFKDLVLIDFSIKCVWDTWFKIPNKKAPLTLRSALELVYPCSWVGGSSLAWQWSTACLSSSLRKGEPASCHCKKNRLVLLLYQRKRYPHQPLLKARAHWKWSSVRYYRNALVSHNPGTFFYQTHVKPPCQRKTDINEISGK